MDSTERELLPTNVRPTHYSLFLFPDLEKFTFEGTVEINLNVNENSNEIETNAYDMDIHSAIVCDETTMKKQEAEKVEIDETKQVLKIKFNEAIKKGSKAKLTIKFTGKLNNEMNGFYRSEYTDSNKNKKYMAVTQFESVYARRSFPCWDEPAIKATFDVQLRVEKGKTALSNMPIVNEKNIEVNGKEYVDVKFDTTPIMSTYLLAYIVGELDYIETVANPTIPKEANPIKIRVYTLKGESSQGKYAAEVTARVLEYFSEYFNIPYPLPKMDLIAIPDFEAGAMENWGLVTFRTVALLFDENKSSASTKERVCTTVAHEIAHQWFGNLVTMEWWSDLWLNEGFATFVGTLATDHLNPDWDIFTQFVTDDLQQALSLDGLRSSHPIQVNVKKAFEIDQIFDQISYEKGATIIRMLNSCLGEEKFMNGVRIYLKRHMYGNTVTSDLWKALSESSGIDVENLMGSWVKDVGYPIVKIEKAEQKGNQMELSLSQNRFISAGDMTPEEEKKYATWWIPLGIISHQNHTNPTNDIQSEKKQKIVIPYADNGKELKFYKLNYKQTGMYRVKYPSEMLNTIGEVIKMGLEDKSKEVLGISDRVGIITDIFALAKSGSEKSDKALEMLKYFTKETEYVVLCEIFDNFSAFLSSWYNQSEKIIIALKKRLLEIFSPIAEKCGFDFLPNESHIDSMKRTLVIKAAGVCEDKKVIAEARRRFDLFIKGDQSVLHPNIRRTVFSIVMKNGTPESAEKDYDAIFKIYQTSEIADQRLNALNVLGCSSQQALVKRTVDMALDPNIIRFQDIMYCIQSIVGDNPNIKTTRPYMWKWMVDNWDVIESRYKTSASILAHIARICISGLSDMTEVQAWVEKMGSRLDVIRMPINQTLERCKQKITWIERDRQCVEQWAEKNM